MVRLRRPNPQHHQTCAANSNNQVAEPVRLAMTTTYDTKDT
jgi:hypothetical protein